MPIRKILILTFVLSQIVSNAIGQAVDIKSIQTIFASKTEGLPSDIGNYFNDKVSNQINHFNALSINEYANLMVQVSLAPFLVVSYYQNQSGGSSTLYALFAFKFLAPPEDYFFTNNLFKTLEYQCSYNLGSGYLPSNTDSVSVTNIQDINGVSYTKFDLGFTCKKDCTNRRKALASLKKQYDSDYNYIKLSMGDDEILAIGDEHFVGAGYSPSAVYDDLPSHTRQWLYQTHQIYQFNQFVLKLYNSYKFIVNKKKLEQELLKYCPFMEAEPYKVKRYE